MYKEWQENEYKEKENYNVYGLETRDGYDDKIRWFDDEKYDADPESEVEIATGERLEYRTTNQYNWDEERNSKRLEYDDQIEGVDKELIEALYRRVKRLEKQLDRKEVKRGFQRKGSDHDELENDGLWETDQIK